jgi:fructan beta-fructosidase
MRRPAGVVLAALLVAGITQGAPSPAEQAAVTKPAYTEPHRPQFHFTPPSMWMNDPNGLVYYDGEYHLFYQYHPADTVWGPMHWGHAVSRDLVHWEHLPIALAPDERGYIFSGSAVVDWRNTSGLGKEGEPPLVALFTYHDPVRGKAGTGDHESQGLAWSNDRGRTWAKYPGNPVVPNVNRHKDFRDPKVFWHEPSQRWIMALSVFDHVEFHSSRDLKQWQRLGAFGAGIGAHGGTWECPDLFPLRLAGTDQTKWVLVVNLNPGGPQGGSGTQYFVGDFDGHNFTLDADFERTLRRDGAAWLDWGRDNYAGITWSDVPAADGRRLYIGWMSNWDYAQKVPTHPWRSAMTVPRSLELARTTDSYIVRSQPVRELGQLRSASVTLPPRRFEGTANLADEVRFPVATSEVELEFDLDGTTARTFGISLSNDRGETYRLDFDRDSGRFVSDRTRSGPAGFSDAFLRAHAAPRAATGNVLRMRVFIDVASAELFADEGATVLTDTFFPSSPYTRLRLHAEGGPAVLRSGAVHQLRSIWPAGPDQR